MESKLIPVLFEARVRHRHRNYSLSNVPWCLDRSVFSGGLELLTVVQQSLMFGWEVRHSHAGV